MKEAKKGKEKIVGFEKPKKGAQDADGTRKVVKTENEERRRKKSNGGARPFGKKGGEGYNGWRVKPLRSKTYA